MTNENQFLRNPYKIKEPYKNILLAYVTQNFDFQVIIDRLASIKLTCFTVDFSNVLEASLGEALHLLW